MAALSWPADSRGQLLLSGAFALAVLFVVLALALNAAIFTANQGSQGSDAAGGHEAVQFNADAQRAAVGLIQQVNDGSETTYDGLVAALDDTVSGWSDVASREVALTGGTVALSLSDVTNGSTIQQRNASRTLTNVSGAANWTLVDGADAVRSIELTVTNSSLVSTDDDTVLDLASAGAFRMQLVEAGGDSWRVFVYAGDDGDVLVAVEAPDGSLSAPCRATPDSDGTVTVGVSAGTVGGADCAALAGLPSADSLATVAYQAGDSAAGTYSMVADRLQGLVADADYAAVGSGSSPTVHVAVYDATVAIDYTTPSVVFDATATVRPGDTDA